MKKYYIEIYPHDKDIKNRNSDDYLIQSRWYNTEEKALQWANDIDYKDEAYDVCLMSARWDEKQDVYHDIELERFLK